MTLLDDSVTQALAATRIISSKKGVGYLADNPVEAKAVIAYLKGATEPSSVSTAMGKHLVYLEKARRQPVPPLPPPEQIGDILEIAPGTYTVNQFNTLVDAAFQKSTTGRLTAKAVPGTSPVVTGNHQQRNRLNVESIIFDGLLQEAECGITGKIGWSYKYCTFRNYFKGAGVNDQHSQAIAIWGGNSDFLIDECKFYDSGTTSHIWMSYFGFGPQSDWWKVSNFPKNGCVRNCGFGPTYGAYFGVHYTTEAIVPTTNIKLDSNYLMPSASLKPGQRNPELYFDQKLVGVCS